MFCANCGEKISEGKAFCRHCGAPVGASVVDEAATRVAVPSSEAATAVQPPLEGDVTLTMPPPVEAATLAMGAPASVTGPLAPNDGQGSAAKGAMLIYITTSVVL